jgi:hypothetical protein
MSVGLRLRFNAGVLRIEAWDQVGGVPEPRQTDRDAEAGRGLAMVEVLTGGNWGWERVGGGWKYVWAEVCYERAF